MAPQLGRPYLHLIYQEFWELRTEAPSGMGASCIPKSAIRAHAREELRLAPDEVDAFVWIIRRVDTHFVNKSNSVANKSS